jgi:hypothetical protein
MLAYSPVCWPQNRQLAESDMEGRACECNISIFTIFMLDYYHVYCARECCRVDFLYKSLTCHEPYRHSIRALQAAASLTLSVRGRSTQLENQYCRSGNLVNHLRSQYWLTELRALPTHCMVHHQGGSTSDASLSSLCSSYCFY